MYEAVLTKDVLVAEYVVDRRTKAEIARKFGVTVTTINNYLKRHEIPKNPTWVYKSDDLSGMKFGRLLVKERGALDRHHKMSWVCLCDCGKEKSVAAASLTRGLTQSCGCLKHELVHKGHMDISASFWRRLVQSASQRNIELDITPEYVWSVYEQQGRECAYTGLPLYFHPDSNKPQSKNASIDRIDSFKGYVRGNIQIIHKTVNLVKNWLPEAEFVALCNLVALKWKMNYEDCVNRMARPIYRKIRP